MSSLRRALLVLVASALIAHGGLASERDETTKNAVDELMELLGGRTPYPPESILDRMSERDYEPFGAAVIPHGRSLERRHTTERQPRSMIAYYFGPRNGDGEPTDPRRFVFVAYTPARHQLDLRSLRDYRGFMDRTVLGLISGDRPLMPPPGSRALPTGDERRRMIGSLVGPDYAGSAPCDLPAASALESPAKILLKLARGIEQKSRKIRARNKMSEK